MVSPSLQLLSKWAGNVLRNPHRESPEETLLSDISHCIVCFLEHGYKEGLPSVYIGPVLGLLGALGNSVQCVDDVTLALATLLLNTNLVPQSRSNTIYEIASQVSACCGTVFKNSINAECVRWLVGALIQAPVWNRAETAIELFPLYNAFNNVNNSLQDTVYTLLKVSLLETVDSVHSHALCVVGLAGLSEVGAKFQNAIQIDFEQWLPHIVQEKVPQLLSEAYALAMMGMSKAMKWPPASLTAAGLQLTCLVHGVASMKRGTGSVLGQLASSVAHQLRALKNESEVCTLVGSLNSSIVIKAADGHEEDWMSSGEGAELLFSSALLILGAAWERRSGLRNSQLACMTLSILSFLQLSRKQSAQYVELVKQSVEALAADNTAEDTLSFIRDSLPRYQDTRKKHDWLSDGGLAARAQFCLLVLAPLLPSALLGQGGGGIEVVLNTIMPVAFLFLRHPHKPTASAALHFITEAITLLPVDKAEMLGPYFVKQCLSEDESGGGKSVPIDLVVEGLGALLKKLGSSPTSFLCLKRVASRGAQLSQSDAARRRGIELFAAAAFQLNTVHLGLLDAVKELFEEEIAIDKERHLIPVLYECVNRLDDATRKTELVAWYLNVASTV